MTDLQSTLESIDRALDDCDAESLPPLDKTCLRQGCSNVVVDPVNPDYCSDRCRVAAAVADFASTALNIQLEPWQVGLLAATFRVPSRPPRTPGITAAEAAAGAPALAASGLSIADTVDTNKPTAPRPDPPRGRLIRGLRRKR